MKKLILFAFYFVGISSFIHSQETLKNRTNAKLGFKTYFLQPNFQHFSFNYSKDNNSVFNTHQNISSFAVYGMNVGFEKFFTKNMYFSINAARTFGNTSVSELNLGVGFQKTIQNKVSFFSGLDFSIQRIQHQIGSFFANNAIKIDNRTFNNENIEVSLGNQMLGMTPKIGLNVQLNECFALYGQINYFIPITNNGYVRFSNGKFFDSKVAHINLDANATDINFENNATKLTQTPFTRNIFSFELGIKIRGKR